MSTQPANQTAADVLTKHITDFNIRDSGGMNDTENVKLCNSEALQALYELCVAALPAEHENTDVPSDRLNAQEDGEVMGWNGYREEAKANLAQVFNQEKTNDQ